MNDDTKLLPLKLRIKFFAYKYGLYSFILFMVFAFAFLLGKHIEAFFLFTTYCVLRYKFPTTFHHKNAYWCVFWSILSFWLCFLVALPLKYSVLSTVVVATVLCFVLYKIQEAVDTRAELDAIKNKPFSLFECSQEEFFTYCVNHGIRNNRVEYVWDVLRSTMTTDEIAEKYTVEYDTVKHDKWRYKKKLLNPVDKK